MPIWPYLVPCLVHSWLRLPCRVAQERVSKRAACGGVHGRVQELVGRVAASERVHDCAHQLQQAPLSCCYGSRAGCHGTVRSPFQSFVTDCLIDSPLSLLWMDAYSVQTRPSHCWLYCHSRILFIHCHSDSLELPVTGSLTIGVHTSGTSALPVLASQRKLQSVCGSSHKSDSLFL